MSDRRTFTALKLSWFPHALANAPVPMLLVGTVGTNIVKNAKIRSEKISPVHPGTKKRKKSISIMFSHIFLLLLFC